MSARARFLRLPRSSGETAESGGLYYGWAVVGLTVVVILITFGIRSAPTVTTA